MGGPPQPGEDQDVCVTISGPSEGASKPDVDAFADQFRRFKAEIKDLRARYPLLKVTAKKICYRKKDATKGF